MFLLSPQHLIPLKKQLLQDKLLFKVSKSLCNGICPKSSLLLIVLPMQLTCVFKAKEPWNNIQNHQYLKLLAYLILQWSSPPSKERRLPLPFVLLACCSLNLILALVLALSLTLSPYRGLQFLPSLIALFCKATFYAVSSLHYSCAYILVASKRFIFWRLELLNLLLL